MLYAGLMLTADGPKVLEFNSRFGDPETQVLLARLPNELGEVLLACVEGDLANYRPPMDDRPRVTVVLACEGYPGTPRTGDADRGPRRGHARHGVMVFHAGTAVTPTVEFVTAGGRVLTVSGTGVDPRSARPRLRGVEQISFEGMQYRHDIAHVLRPRRNDDRRRARWWAS